MSDQLSDLEKARLIAEGMATSIIDAPGGFIAGFTDKGTAAAYVSAISKLNVAAYRTETSVTVTNR